MSSASAWNITRPKITTEYIINLKQLVLSKTTFRFRMRHVFFSMCFRPALCVSCVSVPPEVLPCDSGPRCCPLDRSPHKDWGLIAGLKGNQWVLNKPLLRPCLGGWPRLSSHHLLGGSKMMAVHVFFLVMFEGDMHCKRFW